MGSKNLWLLSLGIVWIVGSTPISQHISAASMARYYCSLERHRPFHFYFLLDTVGGSPVSTMDDRLPNCIMQMTHSWRTGRKDWELSYMLKRDDNCIPPALDPSNEKGNVQKWQGYKDNYVDAVACNGIILGPNLFPSSYDLLTHLQWGRGIF